MPNCTTAAGYLSPAPPSKDTDQGTRSTATQATTPCRAAPRPHPAPPLLPPPTSGDAPGDNQGNDPGSNPGNDNGHDGPSLPVPSITVPAIPHTSVGPVDEVLTTAQAIVQCALDGLVDDPLSTHDDFDQCVEDYTTN